MLKTKQKGFTIVELLIVIVVIGILAAITIVAYNGIQSRARDNIRYADAKAIINALELYKTDKGFYPSWAADTSWQTSTAACAGHNNGYSYSDATDSSWMKPLVDNGYLKKVPVAPNNGCTSFYRYLAPGNPTTYNCPSRTTNWYVLEIQGVEGTTNPPGTSDPADGDNWRPCTGATAGWGYGKDWAFTRDDV